MVFTYRYCTLRIMKLFLSRNLSHVRRIWISTLYSEYSEMIISLILLVRLHVLVLSLHVALSPLTAVSLIEATRGFDMKGIRRSIGTWKVNKVHVFLHSRIYPTFWLMISEGSIARSGNLFSVGRVLSNAFRPGSGDSRTARCAIASLVPPGWYSSLGNNSP